MFKLALNAGHYIGTPGKRCHYSLDKNETREWTLNDRVCDKIEAILSGYDGIEVLRIDDTTGQTDVSLEDRTNKANNWGADFWLSIHHNAAGKVFSGGGIVAYVYTNASQTEVEWQHALYRAAVQSTGLYGNRSNAVPKKDLHELRETKMPSVIMECGFMDSSVDVPIILSEEYADKLANALVKVVVEKSGATEKKLVFEPYSLTMCENPFRLYNANNEVVGSVNEGATLTVLEEKDGKAKVELWIKK
jgi:N-acetylmuramoyl-L-alanine amidase